MLEIKLVKHAEEIEQLVDLFRLSFGRDTSTRLWEWKYITNPLAASMPEVVVAVDNGRIVGARPFLLMELWVKNTKVVTAQHCDTMVHPDYRKAGLFNKMGHFASDYLKANRIFITFGFPGVMSRKGFLSQGYQKVVPTEILFRPVNTERIIAQKLSRRKIATGLGYLYDRLPGRKVSGVKPGSSLYEIEVRDKVSADIGTLDNFRKETVIELARSENNLRWRFDRHPEHTYRYILARKNGKLSGYAVISVQKQPNELVYGMIMDYIVENGDVACFRELIRRAIIELAKTDCDLIVIWAFSDPLFQRELRKRSGFKSTAAFPFNRFIDHGYFDLMTLDEGLSDSLKIYNKDDWRITYAFQDFT
jgi:hypothetical protein